MSEIRVNVGLTPYVNDILINAVFISGQSRSELVRDAIQKRYNIKDLQPLAGPYTLFARISIPMDCIAYVREIAYVNDLKISSVYCAIIDKYINSGG